MDLDEANIAHEGTLAALRQKHNNSMAELGNQIDAINKNKVTELCCAIINYTHSDSNTGPV